MVGFKATKILADNEALAQEFRAVRVAQGYSQEEAARASRIGLRHIKAIESGRLEEIPAGVYRKNFLKEYADFLGFDSKELVASLSAGRKEKEKNDPFFYRVARTRTIIIPKIFKGLAIAAVVITCLFYLETRFSRVVSPPSFYISNPTGDLKINERQINIIGFAEPETQVTINDNLVLLDSEGNFNQLVNLREGMNIITIAAKKKFGPEKKIVKQVLVKSD